MGSGFSKLTCLASLEMPEAYENVCIRQADSPMPFSIWEAEAQKDPNFQLFFSFSVDSGL